jgi:steroid 5-alpha reductase family enzyme
MLTIALLMAGIGTGALLLMMFLIWLISMRINNAGLVDVGWAFGLVVLAAWYACQGPGFPARKWFLAGMVVAWGLRLVTHLVWRIVREPEDGRYQQLRREWQGSNANLRFLFFFQAQALLDILLSLPILIAATNPAPQLSMLEYVGIALWLVAVIGESIADAQLAVFKRDPANRGHVCQRGLWNYSRHPNYFFEWFVWVAWAVYAMASPSGWLALICPSLMLFFLFRVTGIPATEAQALRSRGQEYARYQQTTSSFVPWFRK